MSNAQSGSLNFIELRAPADGAVPSGFQSAVPARRIESCARLAPVPFTKVKSEAPPAIAGEARNAKAAMAASLFIMRPDINPDAR
jgi:hypothetical protein